MSNHSETLRNANSLINYWSAKLALAEAERIELKVKVKDLDKRMGALQERIQSLTKYGNEI
jgi:hypothetical protein